MNKIKEIWQKLNLRVALVGGARVVTTGLGTCHLLDSSQEPAVEGGEQSQPQGADQPEADPQKPEEEAVEE